MAPLKGTHNTSTPHEPHFGHAGADDFLPVLIYVVIHANPPQLASNLEYIQRFRMHSRMASESAYFFTQLVRMLTTRLPKSRSPPST